MSRRDVAGAALCALVALAGCSRRPAPTPSVLLVTLEAVRADSLVGATGARPATPRLDALAGEGVLFEQAYTSAPLCRPAIASVLTGRTPRSHGVHDDTGGVLAPGIPVLAEAFRGRGYASAAFVGSGVVGRASGLLRGFDEAVDDFGAPGKRTGRQEQSTPRDTVDAAVRWLAAVDGARPLFAWVHLRRGPTTAAGSPREAYAQGLAAADAELGRLVDAMRKARPSAIVAVLADHGEALGDHGEDGYGYFVYGSTTRVPLIVSAPGALLPGRRVSAVVRSMDVAPTLFELGGVTPPAGLEGVSLVPLASGRRSEGPGPAPVENASLPGRYGVSALFAVASGPHFYVRAPRPELYDTAQDPGETADLAERLSRVAARLAAEAGRFAPEGAPATGLPDPKDGLDACRRYREAQEQEARGQRAAAIAEYRALLAENAGFVLARRKLSEALLADKQMADAAAALEELVARKQASEATYLNLALVRYRAKDPAGALTRVLEGARAFPGSAPLHHRAARLLLELGRPADAVPEFARAVELEPRLVDGLLGLGQALEKAGRKEESAAAYRRAVDVAGEGSEEGREAALGLARLGAGPR